MTGRVKTYEAIVKGHNVPKPGVPESFKVLVKELQSLCLDIRVLDDQGEEIELRDDDDDDIVYAANGQNYVTDEDEVLSSGYAIDPDSTDSDVSALEQIIGLGDDDDAGEDGDDDEAEDDYTFDPELDDEE